MLLWENGGAGDLGLGGDEGRGEQKSGSMQQQHRGKLGECRVCREEHFGGYGPRVEGK